MLKVVHKIVSWVLKRRMEQVLYFMDHPLEVQERVFRELIEKGEGTIWGKTHGFHPNISLDRFRNQVPISTYEEFFPWINREFQGESNVLWPGRRNWFSKSSGTTNDKSKFIPVTMEALEECHYKAGQDMLAVYLENNPESQLFTGKALSMGGSIYQHPAQDHIQFGDISAVITENLPKFYEMVRAPRKEVAFMQHWEEKIDALATELVDEDITSVAGVPTWTLVLMHYMLDKYNVRSGDMRDLWPNLELFLHGGVSFEPYKKQFDAIIGKGMSYMDCYNASEGFFGFQDNPSKKDLLLLLDYGIFYEFVKVEDLDQEHPRSFTLEEVETNVNYAMVISTNAGLWRYLIGDTVIFTEKYPFRIRISGRTQQYINVFGEELMVDNAERAMSEAAQLTNAIVSNYTAAPIYFHDGEKGGHEWLIEFESSPSSLQEFTGHLDRILKELNSDYEAKREGDLALGMPLIQTLPEGTFMRWLKEKGKLGGQHKVPRLSNNRKYVEDILGMLSPEQL